MKTFEEVEDLCMPGEFDSDDPDASAASEEHEQKQSEFAMKISNCANVVLLAFKVFDLLISCWQDIRGTNRATERAKSTALTRLG